MVSQIHSIIKKRMFWNHKIKVMLSNFVIFKIYASTTMKVINKFNVGQA